MFYALVQLYHFVINVQRGINTRLSMIYTVYGDQVVQMRVEEILSTRKLEGTMDRIASLTFYIILTQCSI